MRIQTKFSPTDKVAFDKDGQRMRGTVYCAVVSAYEDFRLESYDVICGEKIYRIRENELIEIKDDE